MPEPDVALALGFLSQLFAHCDEGWVNIFGVRKTDGNRVTAWAQVKELDSLADQIQRYGRTADLWFGAALRSMPLENGRRGGVADCSVMPALWLDVDIAGAVHKLDGLPQTREEAIGLIRHARSEPVAVVNSGYGFQCWWPLRTPAPAAEAKTMLARWARTWMAHAAGAGVRIDNVFNLDRVMRLPGSFNWKGSQPVPVTVRMRQKGPTDAVI